jgi:hypothetical protein
MAKDVGQGDSDAQDLSPLRQTEVRIHDGDSRLLLAGRCHSLGEQMPDTFPSPEIQ